MAYYPYGPATSDIYTLTSPLGDVAVFNDPTSANYVGMLTEVTGLDSAEVREASEELTEADGGAHGNFFYGRRPIVLTGRVFGHATQADRAVRLDRAIRASNAMRGDAVLSWKPENWATVTHIPMQTWVRRQQPLRISGGWVKEFQLALVSEFAQLFSVAVRTTASTANGVPVSAENQGSGEAWPVISITGASSSPNVTNTTADPDQTVFTTGLTLVAGETVQIDTLTHTAAFTAGPRNGQSANRYIDFGATVAWPRLARGTNSFVLAGGGSMVLTWRDTWV
jgi:hypothetical protein